MTATPRRFPFYYLAYKEGEKNLADLSHRAAELLKESEISYLIIDCEDRHLLHSGELGVIAKLLNYAMTSNNPSAQGTSRHDLVQNLPAGMEKFVGLISTPDISDVINTTGLHHQKNLIMFDNWEAFLARVVDYCRNHEIPIQELHHLGEAFMKKFRKKQMSKEPGEVQE